MEDAVSSPEQPSAKKQGVLPSPINDLADEELLRVFKHLPPYDRLLASEVCRHWNELSRIPWRDVVHLDLDEIRRKSIRPVVGHCPNLKTVFATGRKFNKNELNVFSRTNLSSVNLYGCSAAIPEPSRKDNFDIFSAVFSDDLANASWDELVLHDLSVVVQYNEFCGYPIASSLPTSLERLQLCGTYVVTVDRDAGEESVYVYGYPPFFLSDLGHLQNLTCLILSSSRENCLIGNDLLEDHLFRELKTLQSLRELCLGFKKYTRRVRIDFLFSLPRLEVLFLHNVEEVEVDEEMEEGEDFGRLVTKHPCLRVLVITGLLDQEITIPARRLYPRGFGSNPVPKLHVFVGKQPSEKIVFTKSSADALEIHPITEPLPAFLAKAEIAQIFEGVWVAAQIKEGDAQDEELFEYDVVAATSFRVADSV